MVQSWGEQQGKEKTTVKRKRFYKLSKLSLNTEGGEGSSVLEGREPGMVKLLGLEPEEWLLQGREELEKVLDDRFNSLLPLLSRDLARGETGLAEEESSSITFIRLVIQLHT